MRGFDHMNDLLLTFEREQKLDELVDIVEEKMKVYFCNYNVKLEEKEKHGSRSLLQLVIETYDDLEKTVQEMKDLLSTYESKAVENSYFAKYRDDVEPMKTIESIVIEYYSKEILGNREENIQKLIKENLVGEENTEFKKLSNLLMLISEKIYLEYMEKPYIDVLEAKYNEEATKKMKNFGKYDYLEWMDKQYKIQINRAEKNLGEQSIEKVKEVCALKMLKMHEVALITKENSILESFYQEYEEDKQRTIKVVQTMYKLSKHLKDDTSSNIILKTTKSIKELLKQLENEKIEAIKNGTGRFNKLYEKESSVHADKVLDLVKFFTCVSKDALTSTDARKKIKDAFSGYFGGQHEIELKDEKQNRSVLEGILLNMHNKLSNYKNYSMNFFEEFFEKNLNVYRIVRSKDEFMSYLEHYLAIRIVQKRADINSEEIFINQISELDRGITHVVVEMIKESKLEELRKNINNISVNMMILSKKTFGRFNVEKKILFENVDPLKNVIQSIRKSYSDNFSQRELTILPDFGTAEVTANGYGSQYNFKVTTLFMVILLTFNKEKKQSVRMIHEKTGIKENQIEFFLKKMVKGCKLFKVENEYYYPNEMYYSKSLKIDLTKLYTIGISKSEKNNLDVRIIAERNTIIEAIVVRVMKSHKKLSHEDLIQETIKQSTGRFETKSSTIKRRIEDLIQREFLRRDEEDRKIYHYVA
eukprot:CAMPEP_0117421920 /NCGR_PEP_ID=MMETSP0758-20121206/2871_1 /TAXON_ID=63605 /ORGANISM="Percolomonas cosmopolitus, Strain AE-1 (ATCC 50343)" /LENGTH=702 /DNA_ID=CAMNT_0005204245 /DNA_START=178 /DNA_END=2286 /DNA_ORIENTATION=-